MAEDKKTRIELEEQKKIANDVRIAFGEASGRLRQRYNAEIQRVLDEIDEYNGSVLRTDIGKSLKSFLLQEGSRHIICDQYLPIFLCKWRPDVYSLIFRTV